MHPYHKIQSIYKRDPKTHRFLDGVFSMPEFCYLAGNRWEWTEKVDGTNIRVMWDGQEVKFGGKSDNAQIHAGLYEALKHQFPVDMFETTFDGPACLYGEGYGAKIQKGGGNYKPDGQDFVLFDVKIGSWWLQRYDIEDIGRRLDCRVVPIMGHGSLYEAVDWARSGIQSTWGSFYAEGLVLKPTIQLLTRDGKRIITKVKTKDFA